jgi:pimeloyl-ACP methyl ester carboxylesterase
VMQQRQNPELRQAQLTLADAVFPEGVQAFDLRAELARVEMPARIIWGKSDRIIPWKHGLCAPGRVSLNLFEHTGHMPQLERAAEIAFLLRQTAE